MGYDDSLKGIIMLIPHMQPVPLAKLPAALIPLLIGAAGAGFPSPSQDWQEDSICLIDLLQLDRAASFVFRISGSSMVDAGIYDNDIVVVDRDTRAVDGHVVIAIVDGGFVCRQLARRHGAMYLEARNSRQCYEPTPADGIEIWGVVRTSVRDFRR